MEFPTLVHIAALAVHGLDGVFGILRVFEFHKGKTVLLIDIAEGTIVIENVDEINIAWREIANINGAP
eukprot:GAFH01000361.1.p8 GENE.GAFH01000361.1~~GAFH01000361.1.p8  ORF type:complete len:68 (+),score=4.39 GAFH01000361.1:505-708(+)